MERRPLIAWARQFAKAKQWGDVRGHRCWSRLQESATAKPQLRVALRVELFHQLHLADLAKFSQEEFRNLCELYGVGIRCKVRGGNTRAVELTPEFIADLEAQPEETQPEETQTTDRRTDGQPSHTPACEPLSVCPSES